MRGQNTRLWLRDAASNFARREKQVFVPSNPLCLTLEHVDTNAPLYFTVSTGFFRPGHGLLPPQLSSSFESGKAKKLKRLKSHRISKVQVQVERSGNESGLADWSRSQTVIWERVPEATVLISRHEIKVEIEGVAR